jgi:hypothetical protein
MCKKLMFSIVFVCLLPLASSALAQPIIIPPLPGCHVVTGTEVWDEVEIRGCLIIESTGNFICNERSYLNGPGARIVINGGSFTCNARFDIGQDNDGYVYIYDGGSFLQTGDDDGIKFPDNPGGVHRFFVIDGTLTADRIEQKHDRDAQLIVGCNGLIHVANTDEGDSDPQDWYHNGDLYCDPNCNGGQIIISDLGGNVNEIICFQITEKAWKPDPEDGETAVGAETCDMILRWNEGNCLHTQGRNFVYFSDDCDCVRNQPTAPLPTWNWFPPLGCFLGEVYPNFTGRAEKNVGMLPLWTRYCWRIDQACQTGPVARGEVWTFTTGCELIGGDANLDCLVNFLDYAALASTWMDEQFFPDGCTP